MGRRGVIFGFEAWLIRQITADLRENNHINPATDFGKIFGPTGLTRGPGIPGHGHRIVVLVICWVYALYPRKATEQIAQGPRQRISV